ncbi:unnamed protein product [Clonostachys rosea]|uniref:HhH-GPD domain-containing protein n=1 Tax=Bionectria ochroleuca TaxID=29856 RepID=A0ABY6UQT7_BIOOC|nr:unnamed protein product [Clonostachys rosea]
MARKSGRLGQRREPMLQGSAAAGKTKEQVKRGKAEKTGETSESNQLSLTSSAGDSAFYTSNKLAERKWASWSRHSDSSPFPDFIHPNPDECRVAHRLLNDIHGDTVEKNFAQGDEPVEDGRYTSVMDALVVAALSQATSWRNAKRAMNSMKQVYGSTFAYKSIVEGGMDKLVDAVRPGGMQNRKSKILMKLLHDVRARHGAWDLQFLFNKTDDEVFKEVVSYWGLGRKCAHCLMSICLKRDRFAVDTHIYRLSGLWDWRPRDAIVEKVQAHLDQRIPSDIKFALHYEMIVHGRECKDYAS